MAKARSGSVLDKYAQFITALSDMQEKERMSLGPLSVNIGAGSPLGVPMGRMIQLVGKQSSGKSTLALDIISQYQKTHSDEMVLYIDFERSIDPLYAMACGVDPTRLLRVHADTTEQGLTIVEGAINEGAARLAIIDSIAAAKPASEDAKGYEDNPKMASAAGILTRFCNRISPILDNNSATIILINQLRKNFSMMSQETEIPWGGLALQYAISLSVHLTRIKTEDTKQVVRAHIRKNKVGAAQRNTEFDIYYGTGVDHDGDIINLGIFYDIVKQNGTWLNFDDLKAQGMEKAKATFPIEVLKELVINASLKADD